MKRKYIKPTTTVVRVVDTARAMLTVRTQGRAAELRPIDITEI